MGSNKNWFILDQKSNSLMPLLTAQSTHDGAYTLVTAQDRYVWTSKINLPAQLYDEALDRFRNIQSWSEWKKKTEAWI